MRTIAPIIANTKNWPALSNHNRSSHEFQKGQWHWLTSYRSDAMFSKLVTRKQNAEQWLSLLPISTEWVKCVFRLDFLFRSEVFMPMITRKHYDALWRSIFFIFLPTSRRQKIRSAIYRGCRNSSVATYCRPTSLRSIQFRRQFGVTLTWCSWPTFEVTYFGRMPHNVGRVDWISWNWDSSILWSSFLPDDITVNFSNVWIKSGI